MTNTTAESPTKDSSFVENRNQFAFDIFKVANQKGSNTLLSPMSISTAFSMVYAGAKKETKAEMANVFRFSEKQSQQHKGFSQLLEKEDSSSYEIANAIWQQKGYNITKKFIKTQTSYYKASPHILDFAEKKKSIQTINNWIAEKTNNNIADLVKENDVNKDTKLYLTNAIFFKSDWEKPFDSAKTYSGDFETENNTKIKTDFMLNKGFYNSNFFKPSKSAAQVIELPYKGNRFSMLIIVPNKGVEISTLADIQHYNSWIKDLQKNKFDAVHLPKFKLDIDTDVREILESMGMKKAFSEEANFSGISKQGDLMISDVKHQAKIKVDEKGTEAAASTAIGMASRSAFKTVFMANKTFLFIIKNNTNNNILFIGKFNND